MKQEFYTVQELSDISGYAVSFIYDLTHFGCVPQPIRGLIKGSPSKGLYPARALEHLQRYMELKRLKLKRDEIIHIMKHEMSTLEADPACSSIIKEKERISGGL